MTSKIKRNLIIIVILSLIFMFIYFVTWLIFSGAGAPYRIDSLEAREYFTKEKIKLPFSYRKGLTDGGHSTHFYSTETLEELSNKIQFLSNDEVKYNT